MIVFTLKSIWSVLYMFPLKKISLILPPPPWTTVLPHENRLFKFTENNPVDKVIEFKLWNLYQLINA